MFHGTAGRPLYYSYAGWQMSKETFIVVWYYYRNATELPFRFVAFKALFHLVVVAFSLLMGLFLIWNPALLCLEDTQPF